MGGRNTINTKGLPPIEDLISYAVKFINDKGEIIVFAGGYGKVEAETARSHLLRDGYCAWIERVIIRNLPEKEGD